MLFYFLDGSKILTTEFAENLTDFIQTDYIEN